MSSVKIPAFDLLSGQSEPFVGFGAPLPEQLENVQTIRSLTREAFRRFTEIFGTELRIDISAARDLDLVVGDMWRDGWTPTNRSVNLFVTDFGLILTELIRVNLGGDYVFRSYTDISHLSIWWRHIGIEAFPFHHMMKCLTIGEHNSVYSFISGLSDMVNLPGEENL